MNDLIETKLNEIQNCQDTSTLASQLYIVCTTITPAFYRNLSVQDMQAEITSIKMLIQDIDSDVLSDMCKRAILQYPKTRSENGKTYFDINYILKFYKDAYNDRYCNYITLKRGANLISRHYDNEKGIMYEQWNNNGEIVNISCVTSEEVGTHKDHEAMFGLKWRPHTHKERIYDYTEQELVEMFDSIYNMEI